MIILYITLITNCLLVVLLAIGYRKQIKINRWLCDRLLETLTRNTDAIRELGDDVRNSRTITLNIDSLTKKLVMSNKSAIDKEEVERELIEVFQRVIKNSLENI